MRRLKIGVALHRTGRLAALGRPLEVAAELFVARFPQLDSEAGPRKLELAFADTESDPAGARRAAARLIDDEQAQIVVTLGGTATLPTVVETCQAAGVPCVSTTLPWQAYRAALPLADAADPRRAFHFCWGLDDIAHAFADAWRHVSPGGPVGCLWNSGAQGDLLRAPELGFLAATANRAFATVDLGAYREGSGAFARQAAGLRGEGIRIVTAAATPDDLAAFDREVTERRIPVDLITCSRWLSYPFGARTAGVEGVVTAVYWSPEHPWAAADGLRAAELAAHYERVTGSPWCQPLGPAYALFEVAAHAFTTAADPEDPDALAAAVQAARLTTVAGLLDFTAGPEPAVALLGLATGQWRAVSEDGRLVIVCAERTPDVPITGELRLRR